MENFNLKKMNIISNYDFHDASLYKIEYLIDNEKLVIGLMLDDASTLELVFSEIIGWEFSSFETQNFLLDFRVYDNTNLPKYIIENYEVAPRYQEILNTAKCNFYELDPASGMGG